MEGLIFLIGLVLLYWLIPIVLLIVGLVRMRSRPDNSKRLLIAAGILFAIGAGVCGALYS